MNHYTSIGLPLAEQVHFEEVLPRVLEEAQTLVNGSSLTYYVYTDSSMAQLWLGADDKGIVSFEPFFQGKMQRCLYLDSIYPAENGTALISAWPSETAQQGNIVFSVPDGDALNENQIGKAAQVLLAAFAEDVRVFADDQTYQSASGKLNHLVGSWRQAEQNGGEAYILLTGVVESVEKWLNEFGGKPFYHLVLEVENGLLDAVADTALLEVEPRKGNIVQGLFWLGGRVIEAV
ncbi:hypothetical protein PL75_05350 [Neisseria arctica]|uniref:Uncharacterized protein n=1 Tax=Neisseria arctica TaxID=1470200 RepID=A0A0J1C3Q7_9NEIS|nr:hypothetical protein [Neisseria arctica]KLT72923.1 hypothetical protein PL75_05350 [Neisseria arctica]UOO86423.1 hypothetical protein LVJ86_09475 [Neisseria arctica]